MVRTTTSREGPRTTKMVARAGARDLAHGAAALAVTGAELGEPSSSDVAAGITRLA